MLKPLSHAGMSPRALYRSYLGHLRQIPDPHVWGMLAPHYKKLLRTAHTPAAESSVAAQKRQQSAIKRAKEASRYLEAAVACHPHALQRILEQSYGRRGRVKWDLVKNVTLSTPIPKQHWLPLAFENDKDPQVRYPPTTFQPLPPALKPLTKKRPVPNPSPRARTEVPKVAQLRSAKNTWEFMWTRVEVPLILPPGAEGSTGWEGKGVVESLRRLAGIDVSPSPKASDVEEGKGGPVPLSTLENLPPSLRACFPKRPVKHVPLDYPRPRAALTRQNPKTWGHPSKLHPRLLRRTYRRLWDSLPWVKVKGNGFVSCAYEDMIGQPKMLRVVAKATEEELKWLEEN